MVKRFELHHYVWHLNSMEAKRNIKSVLSTSYFLRAYKKLPLRIQTLAHKKERIFLINPFQSSLRTYKLKGELQNYWSYSVNVEYRILFRFIDDTTVAYFDIGTHSIY